MGSVRRRHLRHSELDGADRGSPGHKRLDDMDEFLNGRTATSANDGIGDTADANEFTVDTSANTLNTADHGLETGDGPLVLQTNGSLPGGLSTSQFYWARKIDADNFALYTTWADAVYDRNRVQISSTSADTNEWLVATDRDAIIDFMKQGVWSTELQQLSDVDDVLAKF